MYAGFLIKLTVRTASQASLKGLWPLAFLIPQVYAPGDAKHREVENFIMAFPTNQAPVIGQQVALTQNNSNTANARIDLLFACADASECELVTTQRPVPGYLCDTNRPFMNNHHGETLSDAALRNLGINKAGDEVTYTCTPVDWVIHKGFDINQESVLDRNQQATYITEVERDY